ncbi:hypothetical protein HPP92_009977 [Vanilla planifolia]|uniref:Uncharacterized protein n=1 Tax=Vanilla planifolia TaxID=51239 RepID=A0A835RGE8_VANPL|nr:hypothetical protein HPP92_009977 [Vanilla planifolia]
MLPLMRFEQIYVVGNNGERDHGLQRVLHLCYTDTNDEASEDFSPFKGGRKAHFCSKSLNPTASSEITTSDVASRHTLKLKISRKRLWIDLLLFPLSPFYRPVPP